MAFNLSALTSLIKSESSSILPQSGILGIDIGSSAIKVVQLREIKGIPTLETYGELQLGPYEGVGLGRSTRLHPQKKIEALVDILREASATAKTASFALSYNACFTTTIQVSTTDPEKLSTMIPVEARKYIPVSLSKVELNWFPLSVHDETKTTTVLISAIYNEALQEYLTVMQGCNLHIVSNEIEIFSMIRTVLTSDDEVSAIIDCGATSTRLCIVRKGVVVKTHSIMLSSTELTNVIAKNLTIEFANAEELKREFGLQGRGDDTRVQRSILSTLERGLREMHTVIKRYEETESVTIQKIVLCGSGALLKGIDTYIQDMFSRPVTRANAFSKVAYPAFLEDTLTQAGPSFAVALGVALRGFQKQK